MVNLDNIELTPVQELLRPAGWLAPGRWHEVCSAMARVLAC